MAELNFVYVRSKGPRRGKVMHAARKHGDGVPTYCGLLQAPGWRWQTYDDNKIPRCSQCERVIPEHR